MVGKENPIPAKIVCVRNKANRKDWLTFDALTTHTKIVFTRYVLLAFEQRQNEEQQTLGELFFFLVDEMADILFRILCAF